MRCQITQPNSIVLEVEVDPKSNGQEVLEKVCQQLGIVEQDYFGLQFQGAKGELLWLNSRNPVCKQVNGPIPYRFQLRVKFYVQPHLLLQEECRHLFYQQVMHELRCGKLQVTDEAQLVRIASLSAQVELGDQVDNPMLLQLYEKILEGLTPDPSSDLVKEVAIGHGDLMRVTKAHAEYRLLQEASIIENYGTEYHEAKNLSGNSVSIGVGPEGIFFYDLNNELFEKLEYSMVMKAIHDRNKVILEAYNDEGETNKYEFKMVSTRAANALYRCITEMHSFFRCDTVHDEVSLQVTHDLKGVLASIFSDNTASGQNYVFDVKQTCKEVYDSTRRKLLKQQQVPMSLAASQEDISQSTDNKENNEEQQVQMLKNKLETIQDSFVCKVCMDNDISTVLCPCGHMVCCNDCASQLAECPLCRTSITTAQPVFLPTAFCVKT
ncbi:E3 ubiquitin-protein ligase MYLIP-like [Mizuhopecten yessoensis]|uniref:E3 ubiquitin-protein ligase MYLIP-B n=1 Tax=Mizuhopecten yessoensis TaxID=6573 RepID=A0A210QXQ3_MIZYE|nr:E3 ubiquitin-protein ligase MYLIP-like [Mizuhopecten yessoensis]OWF53504.1 E3 ubiquitin-protein ligase MYLIP-B [Mizuhopecten yessoensis]